VDGALTGIAPIRPLQLCADGGYRLRLGVLGVPLIMVPDNNLRNVLSYTTGIVFFGECLRHSVKPLSSVTLDKEYSANILSVKSLAEYFFRTLGKDFAECRKALGKLRIEKTPKNNKTFLNYRNNSSTTAYYHTHRPNHFHYYFESDLHVFVNGDSHEFFNDKIISNQKTC
jgi:hypothetical protein